MRKGKKIFLVCVLLFLLGGTLFSDDLNIEDINGVWLTQRYLDNSLNNPYGRKSVSFGLWEDWYIIRWDKAAKKGVFLTGPEYNTIQSVVVVGKRATIKYSRTLDPNREIVLEYVSKDLFRIISSPYNGYDPSTAAGRNYLCRISDFSKKPQAKGKINNYGVRFRNRPELTSGIWFNLDFGEDVEILGISAEKQTIGELEAYWYEVRLNFPGIIGDGSLDGWVFGAYLDVENKVELEERLKKLRRDDG